MTRKEAVIAMLDGKKIEHKEGSQSKYAHMYFDKNLGFLYCDINREESVRSALIYDDGYTTWEEPTTFEKIMDYMDSHE